MIAASAPAKIILFGEHAVVHGQPAIALPFPALRARVEITGAAPTTELRSECGSLLAALNKPQESDPLLVQMLVKVLDGLAIAAPEVALRIRSDIPQASGFGSGAAIAAALTRVLAIHAGIHLGADELNDIVYDTETLFHGTPSGIDNTVIVFEKPLYFVRGQEPADVRVAQPFTLLVADSGERCATHITVSAVRERLTRHPVETASCIEAIGCVVRQARNILAGKESDGLGPLMYENHALLARLGVSSPVLDGLVNAARDAGAAGAKLSGAGRGGNVLALVDEAGTEAVATALQGAGAKRIWNTTVRATA